MGNCGCEQQDAEWAIETGDADLVAFGRSFISNPDLVERFRHGWPLAEQPGPSVWYSQGPEGYTDFPTYQEQLSDSLESAHA